MKTGFKLAAVLTASTLLAACGSDSDDETTAPTVITGKAIENAEHGYMEVTGLDASLDYAYFDLESGEQLALNNEAAASNTEWDIAFYSTGIILNGDYSGPGSVKAAFTDNNADFRNEDGSAVDQKFMDATPQSELPDFLDVTNYTDTSEFLTDKFTTVFGDDYYIYNPSNHELSANAEQYYLLQNEDGFYKVRTTSLSNLSGGAPGQALTEITLGIQFKAMDDQTFSAEQTIEVAQCDGQHYVDFSGNSEVSDAEAWDVTILCNGLEIQLGNDVTAYALEGDETEEKMALIMGEYAAHYLTSDYASTVFKHQHKWYEYNLDGNNKIWSQYGVYLVKTPSATYKFQVTGYYQLVDEVVAGRQISFIYDEVEQAVAE